jgi:xylose dehydrogenase (NAD/NADP)
MSLRWGLLSTARINDALLGSGHGEFVAVASRSAETARAYAAEKGIPRAHGSYDALLADPEVDAVYIGLPNALHVPWSIRALRAGKHVLCEKPMSRRPEDVEEAFGVAEAEGLVLAEAFMWRHHPQVARARELVQSGAIGRLRQVRASFSFVLSREVDVRLQRELDGGALMDVGCYCVSGARALAGSEPVRADAEQVTGGDGVDVALAGVLRFPGDVLASVDCSFTSVGRGELEAIGDEGSLMLPDPWHARAPVIEHRRPDGTERVEVPAANSYALELQDFEAAARGERPPLLNRDDALGQARAIAALYASAESKEQ